MARPRPAAASFPPPSSIAHQTHLARCWPLLRSCVRSCSSETTSRSKQTTQQYGARSAVSLPPRHSCSLVPHPPVAHCACVLLVNLALPPPGRTLSCWLQSAIERRSKSTSLASCLHPPLPCHILPSIYTLDGPLSPLSIPPLLNPIPRSRLCLPSVYATILRRLNTRCRVLHPPGWSSSIGS